MRTVYAVLAVLLLTTVPLTLAIPDTARARRRMQASSEGMQTATATVERPASP
ncbi:MAG: hypothetical protein M3069_10340 [Chloroflexota bacterium]|nr:hypothetical protein [Chloroflexota bacterium]